jgi:hypothetical protein
MRRVASEASHAPPFLDDLVGDALPYVGELGMLSVRDIERASDAELEPLVSLWGVLIRLTTMDDATCVGISKAVMLLTRGRIGPAFDRIARDNLRISTPPLDARAWINCLRIVSKDINAFESKHQVSLDLIPSYVTKPLSAGRIYDMLVGPREPSIRNSRL